jgi:hypothetical protein
MRKMRAFLVLAIAVGPSHIYGQSEAVVTEVRMITELREGNPDTVLSRNITVGEKSRVDYLHSTASTSPLFRAGVSQLMVNDSGITVIVLDSARKLYALMRPGAMLSGMAGMSGMKFETTGDTATTDSLGAGPIIAGHPTVHFRMHTSSRMTMTMFGDTTVRSNTTTVDLYLAPDIPNKRSGADSAATRAATAAASSVMKAMPGLETATRSAGKAMKRLARYGTPLKSITEITSATPAGATTRRTSMEVLSYQTKPVPDSVFVIPSGYRKVSMLDLFAPN